MPPRRSLILCFEPRQFPQADRSYVLAHLSQFAPDGLQTLRMGVAIISHDSRAFVEEGEEPSQTEFSTPPSRTSSGPGPSSTSLFSPPPTPIPSAFPAGEASGFGFGILTYWCSAGCQVIGCSVRRGESGRAPPSRPLYRRPPCGVFGATDTGMPVARPSQSSTRRWRSQVAGAGGCAWQTIWHYPLVNAAVKHLMANGEFSGVAQGACTRSRRRSLEKAPDPWPPWFRTKPESKCSKQTMYNTARWAANCRRTPWSR